MSDGMTGLADQAQRSASEVTQLTKDGAGSVVETTRAETQAVVADARQHAQAVVGETRDQLRAHAGDQMDRLAGTLQEIHSQLEAMSRGDGAPEGVVADVTRQLASRVGSVADRIQGGGVDGVIDDLKRTARNRPGMFLLGALGAGMVAGRLIRSVDQGAIAHAAKGEGDATSPPAVPGLGGTTSAVLAVPGSTVPSIGVGGAPSGQPIAPRQDPPAALGSEA